MESQIRKQKDARSTPEMIGLRQKRPTGVDESEKLYTHMGPSLAVENRAYANVPQDDPIYESIDYGTHSGAQRPFEPATVSVASVTRKQIDDLRQLLRRLELRDQYKADPLMQINCITALNQVCLNTERRTPQLTFKDRRARGDSDHEPVWVATVGHSILGIVGEGTGRSKKVAREKACKEILRQMRHYPRYDNHIQAVSWIRDLVMEGVEPNPGPLSVSGSYASHDMAGPPTVINLAESPPGVFIISMAADNGTEKSVELTVTGTAYNGAFHISFKNQALLQLAFPGGSVEGLIIGRAGNGNIQVSLSALQTDSDLIPPQPVVIAPSTLPVWTTDYGPVSNTPTVADDHEEEELTRDGDVEPNPGPETVHENTTFENRLESVQAREALADSDSEPEIRSFTPTLPRQGTSNIKEVAAAVNDNLTFDERIERIRLQNAQADSDSEPEIRPSTPRPYRPRASSVSSVKTEDLEAEYLEYEARGISLQLYEPADLSGFDRETVTVIHPTEKEAHEIAQRDHAMQTLAVEFVDSVTRLASMTNPTGKYFATMCCIYNVPIKNRFDALLMNISPDEDVEHEKLKARPRKPIQPRRGEGVSQRVEEPVRRGLPHKPTEQVRHTTMRSGLVPVLTRLNQGFKKHPDAVIHWLKKQRPKREFVSKLATHMLGPTWESEANWSEVHLMFYGYIHVVPASTLIAKMAEYHEKYAEKYFELFTNAEADLRAANLHNKIMHAYNGNPLSNDMQMVDKATKWTDMLMEASDSTMPLMTGYELQARITNIVGDINPNQTRIFDQDKLRGNVARDDNMIIKNAAVPYPSTSLIPRQMFSDKGDGIADSILTDVTSPMRVSEVNVAEYYKNPIIATDLSEMISDAVKNNATSNWRRDNTTLAGFSSFDVASINTTLTPKGLSLESMAIKIDFLHSIHAMSVNPSAIPASSRVLFDPWAVADYSQMTLSLNDSPVFGEDCGGNNPVFPWGGEKGSIAFHLTLQSIPLERRADAIICPPGLLQSSEDAQAAIALFALGWAEWPFCLFTLKNPLRTQNDDTIHEAVYIPQQTVTRIPGSTTLDIVLPRRWGESNPLAQANANAQAVVVPRFGSSATVGHPAGQAIPINYVGGAYQAVPLVDYLYSWALGLDTVTIKQYLGRLGAIVGVKEVLNVVHDINMALTQVIPKMTLSEGLPVDVYRGPLENENKIPEADFTTTVALDYCYTSHMEVTLSDVVDNKTWPIYGQTSADYRIFQTNPTVWNKVVLGLAKADNIISERLTDLPIWYGNPSCFFWEVLAAIPHAAAWAIYYSTTGMSALAWATGYVSSQSQWIQEVVRATYCTTQDTGTIIPARFGKIVHNFYKSMFNRSVATTDSSVRGKAVQMTVFDRWLPGNDYATVYGVDAAIYSGLCPVLLPDIWIQYMSLHTPKFAMSFPRPFSTDSTQGYGVDYSLDVHRTTDNDQVSSYIKYPPRSVYPVREGPLITDEEMFNNRIWFTNPQRSIRTMTGQVPPDTTLPPPGFYPAGRNITLKPGEVYPPQLANVSTICVPYINQNAFRLILYLPQGEADLALLVCNRSRRAERSAWLLGNVYIAPKIQYLSNFSDPRFKMTENESDFQPEPVQKVVVAPVDQVRSQAVDPQELPSAVTQLTPMQQPAQDVTLSN